MNKIGYSILVSTLVAASILALMIGLRNNLVADTVANFKIVAENVNDLDGFYTDEFIQDIVKSINKDSMSNEHTKELETKLFLTSLDQVSKQSYGHPLIRKDKNGEINIIFTLRNSMADKVVVSCVPKETHWLFKSIKGFDRVNAEMDLFLD